MVQVGKAQKQKRRNLEDMGAPLHERFCGDDLFLRQSAIDEKGCDKRSDSADNHAQEARSESDEEESQGRQVDRWQLLGFEQGIENQQGN